MKRGIVFVLLMGAASSAIVAARGQQPPTAAAPPTASAPGAAGVSGAPTVLVPKGEPGEPLIVEGRVLSGERGEPVAGADLMLYHTDATGCYSAGCRDERSPGARNARLHGRVKTDAQGRYEFRTIKPGQYPRSGPPAHIHYELTIGQRPMIPLELIFEGDDRLTSEIRERAARHDFYILCTTAKDADGALRCRGADVILR